MLAYIVRRLLLVIPTLLGIMLVNFLIVQAAPGGPVEQVLAEISGTAGSATDRLTGGGASSEAGGATTAAPGDAGAGSRYRGARGLASGRP
jgi:microcin C transport system permease protein